MKKHKVFQELKKFIPYGSTVIAAVSGGADSMALAHACACLAEEKYLTVFVVHVEHGMRGKEALADAELVEQFCSRHGLPFVCEHVNVTEAVKKFGLSTEEAARSLRYQVLQKNAADNKAQFILTAHHSDDQAETVLLRLLRGTSAAGLGGMRVQNGNILRPFLHLLRSTLEDYCFANNIQFCHDSSNDDVYYTRNKIRLELLPYLQMEFNPAVKKALCQSAELFQEDESFLTELADREFAERARCDNGQVKLITENWHLLGAPVRKRLLRRCYFACGGTELGFVHTRKLDDVCMRNISGKKLQLPQQITASYAYGVMSFSSETASVQKVVPFCREVVLGKEAKTEVPGGYVIFDVVHGEQPPKEPDCIIYPLELLKSNMLTVRNRRNGDRFTPYAGNGSKKLKDYFIDKKISRDARDKKILLCSNELILGIFGVANGAWKYGKYNMWLVARMVEKENENE